MNTSRQIKKEHKSTRNHFKKDMKVDKVNPADEINTIISQLVTLETKDILKHKKRRSTNHDVSYDTNNPKKKKKESKKNNSLSVPLPIKSKLENIFLNQESNSEGDDKLPAPIMIKKEEKKTVLLKTDPIYSTSESKDLLKRKNRKSIIQELENKTTSSKRTNLESSNSNVLLVPSPIKTKLENVNQNEQSDSEEDDKLPAPRKIKKEENKTALFKTDFTDGLNESRDLLKKKKRKSVNYDLATEATKLESKNSRVSLVPLPLKTKLESVNQHEESESESDDELPAPIIIQKEENKRDPTYGKQVRLSPKVKEVASKHLKQSSSVTSSSEDEELSVRPMELMAENILPRFKDTLSNKKEKVSHLSTKIVTERFSNSSSENEDQIKKRPSSRRIIPEDHITNSKNNKNPGKEIQPLLKDAGSTINTEKYIQNNSESENSIDEKPISEKKIWIQTLQMENPRLTKQVVDFSLPRLPTKYSLIRVPKNISPNTLRNLKCHFDKAVLNSKQYLFQPLTKKPGPIFVNLNGPRLVTLDKVIVLQKSSPLLPINDIRVLKRENVSLPDTVKARHPLFGIDYKGKIRIEKKIKKTIMEAIERKMRLEKKERKKKHRVKQKYDLSNDEESILNLLNLDSLKKNK